MRLLILFLLSMQIIAQDITWTNNTQLIRSYSSPRTTDINNDGIDDVILGGGVDGFPTPFGVIALDGATGSSIWNMTTRNEMFGSPQFFDYSGDNIDDVLISGRDAELRLINGSTGELIWEFWEETSNPNDFGWYNFYTPQIIYDQTGDGFPDILAANGGDHSLDFSELNRPPGHIMIIDGITGDAFKIAVVPDSNETYLSPIICDLNQDGNCSIIFGTGGESVEGNLWIIDLDSLLNENLNNSIPLVSNSELGHIAPPSIGDLNSDGILDIVTQGFDGKITAINGNDLSPLWQYEIANTESSAAPILGKFSNNDEIDIFATLFSGAMNSYNDYYQVLIDGNDGNLLWMDSIGLINFCSPIAFDSNNNGTDEVLISTINNNGQYFENDLILIDFINNSQESIIGPIAGGNLASTPQITDIDNDGMLDIIYSVQADSLDPFGDGVFYENGINTTRISTNYTLNENDIVWGSYMGTYFNGQINDDINSNCQIIEQNNNSCFGDLGLFIFPSEACPEENNAMINLYISQGTPPFTYNWSNGEMTEDLENIAPGLYSVSVTDAAGVCDTISTEITEYGITSFSSSPTCPGDSDGLAYFNSTGCDCNTSFCQFIWELNGDTIAQGDGSSATETYKYLFDIAAGTYTATIIHPDGCQIQQEIIVPEPTIIDSTYISHECSSNNNGYIDLITNPNDSIIQNYLWNTGDTTQDIYDLTAGSYSVIVSDTICVDTLYFEVENIEYDTEILETGGVVAPEMINLEIELDQFAGTLSCLASVAFIVDQDIEEFSWEIIGGEGNAGEWETCILPTDEDWYCSITDWTESTYFLFNFYTEGIYEFNVNTNSSLECSDEGDSIEIIVTNPENCDTSYILESNKPHIYMDSNNNLIIDVANNTQKYELEIFDINGKKILDNNLFESNILSLENYSPGIYSVRLLSSDFIYANKIVIH